MARTIMVASFESFRDAYGAADAIEDRATRGSHRLRLNAGVLLGKDETGEVSVLGSKDRALFGGAGGALAGALAGMLGGPIGAAFGAGAGALAGITEDLKRVDADETFVSSVIQAMIPGSASIILETDENGAREIHDIIGRCHGRMLRREARWRTPAQAAPSVAFTGADEYTEAPAGQRSDTHHGRAR